MPTERTQPIRRSGYSGIGLETVKALAEKGASVIAPVRSSAKAEETMAGLLGDIKTVPMDLADLGSIRQFAAEMRDTLFRVDLLINDAGVMASPKAHVGPGWESQFGTCLVGHFALTAELKRLLQSAGDAWVVALSSTAHKVSDVIWDDIHFERNDDDRW